MSNPQTLVLILATTITCFAMYKASMYFILRSQLRSLLAEKKIYPKELSFNIYSFLSILFISFCIIDLFHYFYIFDSKDSFSWIFIVINLIFHSYLIYLYHTYNENCDQKYADVLMEEK